MKLNLIHDKEEDQNEIESKYLWNVHLFSAWTTIWRLNLSTLSIDGSFGYHFKNYWMRPIMTLPNNQFLGMYIDTYRYKKVYFISDENFSTQIIDIAEAEPLNNSYDFVSCFYDDSIFIFENELKISTQECIANHAKRYFITQKRWVMLANYHFGNVISCLGFNQKIVMIYKQTNWLIVYDILLDSYNSYLPIKDTGNSEVKAIFKTGGRLYLISYSKSYKIHVTDDIYSEWTFVYNFKDNSHDWFFDARAFYQGSIYLLSRLYFNTFKFKMTNFEFKKFLEIKDSHVGEEIQKFRIFSILINTSA
ncbi:unnamed protein product [Blepharisma stoltei]|uniref:Uncharacterized protein n=1 Tax=Blepharisma stoltei TaxID=1481888 RepID=A0AAU9IF27_9CILI|nr:unnamed protein product [Blepharisma stoltei]